MKTNKKGIDLIHRFEKFRPKAYLCPKALELKKEGKPVFWTIGWGNTTYEDGSPVREGDTITLERGNQLFTNIMEGFEEMLIKALGEVVLGSNQFSALMSFLYNVGPGNSKKDGLIRLRNGQPSTLLRKVNFNPKDPTIRDEFKRWISKGSSFENGLKRRREEEADLYFS